ncbi:MULTISPECIES: LysR family transcriptional regulator [unclassified Curtobacterium]|uniref:LysR family transcriptional regulator n=1 Tax=unclassified Curtobacterium TaxID=257496 RepID=UPI00104A7823|nr:MULTISPECIES: LysR family transcriptional regulator [unclassified Curtobacterium]TCL81270.1 molybdate transport repressor ModE-like protein [Curtobacterium sp. PhB128]TCL99395.1 molybdate transport repressor ModE-like protein [Curtobacterium sp. PhB138]
MDDIDPQLLRILRAVADGGSITRAAAALGSSQPAVSQLLARAERRLGHTLVLRSGQDGRGGRGATLTDAGRVLADHALHVQAALTAAREDLDAVGGLTRGRVRLAGFPSASSALVPAVLARLASTAPGVTTSYVEVEPPEALDLLRSGEVDVALTFTYVGDEVGSAPDPGLVTRALGRDPLALVTPSVSVGSDAADSGAADSGAVDLASHRDARWIGGCPRCRGHLLASCATAGFTPDIVLETDNAAAVVGLVAAGLGVALLPRLALATTVIPADVRVDPVDDDLARRVEVVIARGAERVPSVRAAMDAVRSAAHLLDGPLPG